MAPQITAKIDNIEIKSFSNNNINGLNNLDITVNDDNFDYIKLEFTSNSSSREKSILVLMSL